MWKIYSNLLFTQKKINRQYIWKDNLQLANQQHKAEKEKTIKEHAMSPRVTLNFTTKRAYSKPTVTCWLNNKKASNIDSNQVNNYSSY
jgi:hypothetical protein